MTSFHLERQLVGEGVVPDLFQVIPSHDEIVLAFFAAPLRALPASFSPLTEPFGSALSASMTSFRLGAIPPPPATAVEGEAHTPTMRVTSAPTFRERSQEVSQDLTGKIQDEKVASSGTTHFSSS